MQELVGKFVEDVLLSSYRGVIAFVHPDGSHTAYRFVEESCHQSWLPAIVGVQHLLAATVTEVRYDQRQAWRIKAPLETPVPDRWWRLVTDRGETSISLSSELDGRLGQRWIERYDEPLPESMTRLAEDWCDSFF